MKIVKAFFCIILFSVGTSCTNIFYQPDQHVYAEINPEILLFENIFINTKDKLKLHGWFIPAQVDGKQRQKPKALVVQFHGNAQNISSHFLTLMWFIRYQYDFLAVDYQGYGKSEGKADNNTIVEDVKVILRYAQAQAEKENIPLVLYGQSMGGSLLLKALSEEKPKSLKLVVIEGSFYSFQEVAKDKADSFWLTWPIQFLVPALISNKNNVSPEGLSKITPTPLIVIHSTRDPVVPYSQGKKIYENASAPKELWSYDVESHIHAMHVDDGKYKTRLLKVLDEVL